VTPTGRRCIYWHKEPGIVTKKLNDTDWNYAGTVRY
jgi:hypothetical protein